MHRNVPGILTKWQHQAGHRPPSGKRFHPRRVVAGQSKEVFMRRLILVLLLAGFAGTACAGTTFAADDSDTGKKPAGAAKGAAVGGLAGHEVGNGHAAAGAATGAAIGHHQSKKAEHSKQ
jgi:hypothetical protein